MSVGSNFFSPGAWQWTQEKLSGVVREDIVRSLDARFEYLFEEWLRSLEDYIEEDQMNAEDETVYEAGSVRPPALSFSHFDPLAGDNTYVKANIFMETQMC